jgi:RTX calcium-binding nonapeptide repeat (4 copies)
MANLIVTNLNDSGAGSLREKIQVANASLGVADTITFADNLQGTIILTSGQLNLSDDVTINGNTMGGAGAEITISGNNASRIFNQSGAGTDVVLQSLTLTNGNAFLSAGGAILVAAGSLAISDTTLQNNTSYNGGAIRTVGTATTITNSLLTNNLAIGYGGGIYVNSGSLNMVNSTVFANSATGDGGGIELGNGATVNISSSTITNNHSDTDNNYAAHFGGGIDIYDSISNNAVTLTNTVVADNFVGSATTTESNTHGVIDTANSSVFGTAATITAGTANQLNIADVGLGPLALHGGSTATLNIISPTSVLINAGTNTGVPATDANGVARIDGGRVDVGATEYVEANIVVTTLSDVVNASDGVISLREAVTLATNASPSHIVFQAGMNGSIALATGLILTNNVSINGDTNGDGDSNIILTDTAFGLGEAAISINANVAAELASLTFSGIDSFGAASAISNKGNLTLSYSVLSGNSSTGNASYQIGGNGQNAATVFNSGTMVVNQTLFANNTALGGVGNRGYSNSSGVNGGNASASILNLGGASLTLSGLALIGGTATGGAGERGSVALFDPGHPFIGFNGGNGGSAALGVLNSGTMSGTYGQGTIGSATGGVGGLGGAGTSGGVSGLNGVAGAGDTNNLNLGGVGAPSLVQIGTDAANTVGGISLGVKFFGLGGADNLTGLAGSFLFGGSGGDTLTSSGNSGVYGGLGSDVLRNSALSVSTGIWDGGAGVDTFDASNGGSGFGLYIDLSAGTTNVSGTVLNIENIIGTNNAFLNDRLTGDAGANIIQGLAGTDVINGLGDNDTLSGGTGSDTVNGGAGQDVINIGNGLNGDVDQIDGGSDRDLLDLSSTTNGAIWIDFGYNLGPNQLFTFNGFASIVNMESMIGTAFGDTMRGDVGSNFIDGGAGADQLLSYSPYDTVNPYASLGDVILGGAGNDLLFSGTGNDYLDGGADNDTIEVGGGTDTIVTGTGNDTILFSPRCGTDTITDFTGGAGVVDVLKLYGFGTTFDTFAEVFAVSTQVGANTQIALTDTTIILQNFTRATLVADDFLFV